MIVERTRLPRAVAADPNLVAPWDTLDDRSLLAHLRSRRDVWLEPVFDPEEMRRERIDALLDGRFEFNGEVHDLPDPVDWLANPSVDVEWHILLHKFPYAVGLGLAWRATGDARYVRRWMELIEGWIAVTPPGFIAADVTGRRVQNWIYSLHLFVFDDRHGAPVDAGFLRRMLRSLDEQVQFLCGNLTAKRNHRTLELHAIFLAGVAFPEMRRAMFWREFALVQTLANVRADLLADGVHCELSTDYHHLALRNWLQVRTLAHKNGHAVPAAMDAALQRALTFSLHVHKPDGAVPSLSDGDVRSFADLLHQGAELYGRADLRFAATRGADGAPPERRIAHFDAAGYSIVRSAWERGAAYGDAQFLAFDCGPLGEGNHGHFDALSFELAAFGRSLVVDPGRFTYSEAGPVNWRVHFRSTAAHNTVCVDDRPQTRYEPKVARDPSRHGIGAVRHRIAGPAPDTAWIERAEGGALDLLHGRCASHEYDAVHDRCIVFVDRRYWIVSDWLRADTEHDYRLNFQLGAAAAGATRLEHAPTVLVRSPGLLLAQPRRPGVQVHLADGWVSERYGSKAQAPAVRAAARGRDVQFETVLVPWRDQEPDLTAVGIPIRFEDGGDGVALGIHLVCDGRSVMDGWYHARGGPPRHWRFGAFAFRGRWLHWREDADGRLVRAVSHAGAELTGPAGPLPLAVVEER